MSIKKILLNSWVKPNALTGVLRPFSAVYQGVFALRKKAFKRGLFECYQAPVPVIVVGNLTVGGTGKTPLVVYMVQALRMQGFTPGVISRGYSGSSERYPLFVAQSTPVEQSGDEPALIVGRTKVPMVVGPNRRESIELLLQKSDVDIIVSDDGLQHLALDRDIEICLVDETSIQQNNNLLPAGPYRESLSRLMSVDFIVRHGGKVGNAENQYSMELEPSQPLPLDSNSDLEFPHDKQLHAVAGIGKPQRFFDTCRNLGYQITAHEFDDHHHFSASEIQFSGETVLMTEKDAVKCRKFARVNHWYLPVDAILGDGFIEAVAKKTREKFNNRAKYG